MGDLGIPTSAPGSARPSLSVSVIGLLVAPVMSSLDQSQRKYPEVNICINKLFSRQYYLEHYISGDWYKFVKFSC